jgi:hypothetical protein
MNRNLLRNDTKREMITRLLLDTKNRHSAREIAEIVGTSKGNVLKEKSRIKTNGSLSDEEIAVLSRVGEADTLTVAHIESKTSITQSEYRSLIDIPSATQGDLKMIFSEFRKGKSPVEIIAEFGFNPRLIEVEYSRFLRLNGFMMTSLLKDVIDIYRLSGDAALRGIIHNITQNGILSNSDLLMLIRTISSHSVSQAEASIVNDMRQGLSIGPFKSYPCQKCGQPIIGALFDEESDIGRNVKEVNGLLVHSYCGGV